MSTHIAKYVLESEYRCPCCGGLPPAIENGDHLVDSPYRELFQAFEAIRKEWGEPIDITSGYRCVVHNKAEGGSPLSTHQWGLALDMVGENKDEVKELFKTIKRSTEDLRIGVYTKNANFVHIDTGYWISPRPVEEFRKGYEWND